MACVPQKRTLPSFFSSSKTPSKPSNPKKLESEKRKEREMEIVLEREAEKRREVALLKAKTAIFNTEKKEQSKLEREKEILTKMEQLQKEREAFGEKEEIDEEPEEEFDEFAELRGLVLSVPVV